MKNKNDYIEAAQQIIVSLGLPRAQQNERSALCLLALLNLMPGKVWADAENPLIGITPIMDWAREHYDKEYAPNTRETIRRQTMHQFCDAGVTLYNPDKPNRPVNSPKARVGWDEERIPTQSLGVRLSVLRSTTQPPRTQNGIAGHALPSGSDQRCNLFLPGQPGETVESPAGGPDRWWGR
jgi:hypothetical protein